jgi:hypothetical protein|tara:strand:+ start:2457 stop:3185 length:729 start_codon:yes stop_codon:yes gene_type:complete
MTKSKPNELVKLSRSKWENFIRCPFCFYLKEKHNIDPPSMPGHPINSRVDTLLKKEFSYYREKQKPHPIFIENKLNFVPYNLDKLDEYRNRGVFADSTKTGFNIYGKLDDLWLNKDTDEIVVLDYKATSNKNNPDYVNSSKEYHKSYRRQLDFYAYLLKLNNYKVFKTGYWLICNARDENQKTFEGKLNFKITMLSYDLKTDYIEDILVEIEKCLQLQKPPLSGKSCSNCIWQNQIQTFKKQ